MHNIVKVLSESNENLKSDNIVILNEEINEFKKSLEEKYGSVTINLQDGSFKPIEKESVEDKKN